MGCSSSFFLYFVSSSIPDRAPSVAGSYWQCVAVQKSSCFTVSDGARFSCVLSVRFCISHKAHPTEPCCSLFLLYPCGELNHLCGIASHLQAVHTASLELHMKELSLVVLQSLASLLKDSGSI